MLLIKVEQMLDMEDTTLLQDIDQQVIMRMLAHKAIAGQHLLVREDSLVVMKDILLGYLSLQTVCQWLRIIDHVAMHYLCDV